ncbi:metal ABC transporter permease [Thermosulfurimonas marina]|uniref:metal ABC transporter permease n=1 Tax=Thermosulfurimonas marina TaxID=2047767 RepID=UPI00144AABBB|nr:metal ABC transporter permease [Thermosulfurimonas marina]
MWPALLGGLALAVAGALVGLFLIIRRDSLLPHALTHVAFVGVALGFLTARWPLLWALGVTVLAAFVVLEIRERAGIYEDTAVGILAGLGMALALVLASLAGSYDVRLLSYLFGNILALSTSEALLAGGLALLVVGVVAFRGEAFFFVAFDEESAATCGLPVRALKFWLAALVAALVVLGMRMVGLLLVSALMVIPGAAALEVARGLRQCYLLSALFGALSVLGGLAAAVLFNLPPSGAIVLFSGGLFLLSFGARRLK